MPNYPGGFIGMISHAGKPRGVSRPGGFPGILHRQCAASHGDGAYLKLTRVVFSCYVHQVPV